MVAERATRTQGDFGGHGSRLQKGTTQLSCVQVTPDMGESCRPGHGRGSSEAGASRAEAQEADSRKGEESGHPPAGRPTPELDLYCGTL